MLIHHPMDTDGAPSSSAVKLNSRTVDNFIVDETCHSGLRTLTTGVAQTIQANGGFSAIIGEWLLTGPSSDFFMKRTIISGALEVDSGSGGGFVQMNNTLTYDNQKASVGIKTTVVFFEISSDMSGSPIVDTATMTFISEQETGE